MNIKIKRFDNSIPLPAYKTAGAAGFDLAARISVTIPPLSVGYAPLNVAIELPKGHFALLAARSSLHKSGLMFANSVGIIDEDFSGNDDEWQAALYNFTTQPVTVAAGTRIAQGVIVPTLQVEFSEVAALERKTRGGFGSTGSV